MSSATQPQPFHIKVKPETLDWVTQRVNTARIIPDVKQPEGKEWADGAPSAVISNLVEYWKTSYDWRKVEEKLNSTYKMFTLDIPEGDEIINLHFVHHRSKRSDAIPLLFAHGWPGNFTEVESLLSMTDTEDLKQQAFHIVAPSIPGYVFSSSPKAPGFGLPRMGSVYNQLVLKLGYSRYIGQGGDWGSIILRFMRSHRHHSRIRWPFFEYLTSSDLKTKLERLQWWMKEESGYSAIQSTKPQTISLVLMDSPVGMLAWIREKVNELTEPGYVWDEELIITWTMLYLLSESSRHARIYKEGMPVAREQVFDKVIPAKVAFGASVFPYDAAYTPLWWAKVTLAKNIVFYKEHSKGGHFACIECTEALKQDIRGFAGNIPEGLRRKLQSKGPRGD